MTKLVMMATSIAICISGAIITLGFCNTSQSKITFATIAIVAGFIYIIIFAVTTINEIEHDFYLRQRQLEIRKRVLKTRKQLSSLTPGTEEHNKLTEELDQYIKDSIEWIDEQIEDIDQKITKRDD